mmetsp:Transcript_43498/g.93161  ORF Transcript_43498/g.93161 Transcript_43498/m.93161 type:complete len:360 (+) Transcript_43498:1160-2239(+)
MLALRAVDLLLELHEILGAVARALLSHEALQRGGCAGAHITLALQQLQVGVGQVHAASQHLGPSLAAVRGLLDHDRELLHLVGCRHALVLNHGPGLIGESEQSVRSGDNGAHEVRVVVLQNPRRDDPKAAGDKGVASLLPVVQDGLLHLPSFGEGFHRVAPELLLLHNRQLGLHEKIPLAVRSENEHSLELLLVAPVLAGVNLLDQEKLVDTQDGVVGHPTLGSSQIRCDEGFHIGPHLLCLLVAQLQVVLGVLQKLHAQLALEEAEELVQGGFGQGLTFPRRWGPFLSGRQHSGFAARWEHLQALVLQVIAQVRHGVSGAVLQDGIHDVLDGLVVAEGASLLHELGAVDTLLKAFQHG